MSVKQAELANRYGIVPPYPDDLTVPPPDLFPKRPAYVVREQDGRRVHVLGLPAPSPQCLWQDG